MKKDLESYEDNFEQLANIYALLSAYRPGQIEWNIGFVTYWPPGVQICRPRRFDWDEFEVINSNYECNSGFWTEGVIDIKEKNCQPRHHPGGFPS